MTRLRALAELLPAGSSITLSDAGLRALLDEDTTSVTRRSDDLNDYTVPELAELFERKASTVRGWLDAGRFPDAYKLNGRDWRVPRAGVEAFRREQILQPSKSAARSQSADLGAWRKVG